MYNEVIDSNQSDHISVLTIDLVIEAIETIKPIPNNENGEAKFT